MIKLGCCGDDCNYCPRYTGTINNDPNELKKAAEIWHTIGWRDTTKRPEEMRCSGCPSIEWCVYGMKECCEEKHIDNCGYCSKYPCDKLKEAFKKTNEFKEKSKLLLGHREFEILNRAFYMKEERLNGINRKN